jgi:hypothetical protein
MDDTTRDTIERLKRVIVDPRYAVEFVSGWEALATIRACVPTLLAEIARLEERVRELEAALMLYAEALTK